MKSAIKILTVIFLAGLISCQGNKSEDDDHSDHQTESSNAQSKSPAMTAMTNIGSTHVHIEYHAPSVRGRQIFGGLVAFNEVWVTGAHSATSINFYENVKLNNQPIPKGKYALFTIPGEENWTVIINKNFDQHLADDYDQELDVIRFDVTPELLDSTQEQLLYEVTETVQERERSQSPGRTEK